MGGDGLIAPAFPWHHKNPLNYTWKVRKQFFQGHDWASIRRGRQIYTEVFAPCHSLEMLSFRHLQEFMTTEEVKELAAESEVFDEPDDIGEVNLRPSGLLDKLPKPYPNAKAASAANSGANPPDLTLITKGRDGGENYVYALLTSYGRDLPAGVKAPSETLAWNPYFPGGFIGMPKPLSDEMVEYDDGTPASTSQMSKDVCCFLAWCAEPWMDERKYLALKGFMSSAIVVPFGFYWFKTRMNITKMKRFRNTNLGKL